MKTKLPQRSLVMKPRLEAITQAILDVAQDKISMIVLFGSYARGDWVEDEEYKEGRMVSYYQSDLDIMLVMKKSKYASGNEEIKIEERIEKRLKFLRLDGATDWNFKGKPPITLIFESIKSVTKGLENGRYFYTDIKKEGVTLYDNGEFVLPEPKKLNFKEWKEIAQNDYDDWYPMGCEFLINCINCMERGVYKIAAFELQQATENLYTAILLVFSGYKPRTHALTKLRYRAKRYDAELPKIFPLSTPEQKELFTLLRDAYVRARYDKTYKITKEQLLYLISRVEQLKAVTERICLHKLSGVDIKNLS